MDMCSDEIALYEECSRLLERLDKEKQIHVGIVSKIIGQDNYSEKAILELINVGAAERGDNGTIVCSKYTHEMRENGFFLKKINDLENRKILQKLNERSVQSSESTAQAANISAKNSKSANKIAVLALIVSILSLLVSIFSCNDINKGEMWREKLTLLDNSRIFLYHSWHCSKDRPFFANKEDVISFMKHKNYAFDFCFSEEELKLLDEISRYNIKEYIDNAPMSFEDENDLEHFLKMKETLDSLPCDYYINY